jgi:predicted nucleic acid-binding protein
MNETMSYWVVDANLAVNTALNLSKSLERFWERVNKEQITPCAPRLWMSETTSAVRVYLAKKQINDEEAKQALLTIHALSVEIIDEDKSLCMRALELAGMLAQTKAYDAFYLAIAEKMVAEFWTADERLHNRCVNDLKLNWVHWLGEL